MTVSTAERPDRNVCPTCLEPVQRGKRCPTHNERGVSERTLYDKTRKLAEGHHVKQTPTTTHQYDPDRQTF